ncbi:hypothetical protein [Wolbachia endosymbiont (group A) of Anomoia purmunda]|uniref:hypothetical protein n=1 Tax=Wolbachia endosymbiont (group A) of Anomoia purmunda TaxID=2953978 RepID=UPI0022322C57|nr:hypothetical protein [Wolbachia endosymbiont (group A) of Anomoia purmunda]
MAKRAQERYHSSAQTLGSRKKEAGSQCLSTGMIPHWWELLTNYNVRTVVRVTLESSSYCTFTWCRVKFPGSK